MLDLPSEFSSKGSLAFSRETGTFRVAEIRVESSLGKDLHRQDYWYFRTVMKQNALRPFLMAVDLSS
jgi:hypothetical protein